MDAAGADDKLCWPAVRFWLAYMSIGVLAWLLFAVWVPSCQYESRMNQARRNMHLIQLGLERFAVDSPGSVYPASIDELLEAGYLEQMPVNPFTGQPMRCVPPDGEHGHGDFSYLLRGHQGVAPASELRPDEILGYDLVLY